MTFLCSGRGCVPVSALAVFAAVCIQLSAHAQTQAASVTLPLVTVTATRFAEDPSTLPFGVSVLTADDIRHAGVSTVNEALMKLLGVPGRLDFYGGGNYGLDLRGFGVTADSNQVVIVDGVRVSEADLGGTRLAGIPIDSVDRIEVIRGSSAVLYGGGATGGAIVITTKGGAGRVRENGVQLYGAMGSDALAEVRASGTVAAGGFSLDVAANKRSTDGHRDNFRSDVDGSSVTGQWRNEWLRVGATHTQDSLDTGLPGALTAAQYAANPRQTNTPNDHANIDNQRDGFFSEATFGDWQIGVDAGHREKTLSSLSFGSPYDYNIDAHNRGVHARHSTPIGRLSNTVVAGVDHNDWTRVVAGAFGSTGDQTSNAVYLKDDLGLPSGTHLSAGLRTEHGVNSVTGSSPASLDKRFTAWDVGVVQSLTHSASVYARWGRSFRFANVDEIGFVAPGSLLQPQTSRDLDLGARWAYSLQGRAELRYFRNALHDEIGYDPTFDGPFGAGTGANRNFEPTLHQGVELEVTHALTTAVQLRLNATARQAKFTAGAHEGKSIALVPKRTASVGADWQIGGGHQLNGLVNVVSSQSPDFANSCSMPAYTTADLRYAYRNANVELGLGIANVTDKKYYTQAFSCVAGVTNSIYPEAGRGVTASVRLSF